MSKVKKLIGKDVKIFNSGGVYSTINQTDNLKWPSTELKEKSGENSWGNYEPKAGDTGTVVHVFKYGNKHRKFIFILDVDGHFVPIGCKDITDIDRPDEKESWENYYYQDSIKQVEYAAGCEFKMNGINSCWNRAGVAKIDIVSETFACQLLESGIDTVLLCKNMFDNGSSPYEKAGVFWLKDGKSYLKLFFNNSKHEPTQDSIRESEALKLFDFHIENRIDTITTQPNSDMWISHSMGYVMQLYLPNRYYCERIPDYLLSADTKHIKSIWWNMVIKEIENNIPPTKNKRH